MRKWILCTIVFFAAKTSLAQQMDTLQHAPNPKNYLKKSRNQKTIAWVLTGTGTAALAITGLAAAFVGGADAITQPIGGLDDKPSFAAPLLISGAAIAGGIILFSAAAKNKKRAAGASISLNMVPSPFLNSAGIMTKATPALAVKFSL
jgi:hypothetical protein